jgi:FMN phosphatase YigB (HAD superfamily)
VITPLTDSAAGVAAAGVRAVLFDVDGTLYSQSRLRVFMAGEFAWTAARSPSRMLRVARIITTFRRTREHLRAHGRAALALDDLQFDQTAERLGADVAEVRDVIGDWIFRRPLPYLRAARRGGMDSLLAALDRQQLRIGALSDYPVDAKLDALGVARYFSVRLCTTDPSINAFKPHPRGFLVACEHWGFAPQEVLYVGDRPEVDAAGAAAAGTRCIIVGRGRRHGSAANGGAPTVRRFADISRSLVAG